MEIDKKYEKNLRRDIYALRRELKYDIRDVREAHKKDFLIPDYAVKHMTDLNRIFRNKSVRAMDYTELLKVYRKMLNIRGLKSSTLEGATNARNSLINAIPKLSELNEKQADKMWSAYERLVEQNAALSQYKYDIYNAIADVALQVKNLSVDDIASKVDEIYILARGGELQQNGRTDKVTKLLIQSFK